MGYLCAKFYFHTHSTGWIVKYTYPNRNKSQECVWFCLRVFVVYYPVESQKGFTYKQNPLRRWDISPQWWCILLVFTRWNDSDSKIWAIHTYLSHMYLCCVKRLAIGCWSMVLSDFSRVTFVGISLFPTALGCHETSILCQMGHRPLQVANHLIVETMHKTYIMDYI